MSIFRPVFLVIEQQLSALEYIRAGEAHGLAASALMVLTTSGLISRERTSSTICAVAASVTRWPWMKLAASPAFSMAR